MDRAEASVETRGRWRAWFEHARWSRAWLWSAFVLVHAATMIPVGGYFHLGDVREVYLPWAQHAVAGGDLVGIHSAWVYPIGAIVPVLVPILFGAAWYELTWVLMVTAVDAVALAVLTRRRSRRRWQAAWWWLAFILLLGPVGLARLDSVCVPIAIIGLVWLARRPRVAVVLLTVATWIKVWPAALLFSILIGMRRRLRTITVAVFTSAAVVAVPLVLGAGGHLLSFVGTQDARGLQVESLAATVWMWSAAFHVGGSHIVHDAPLHTYEVAGPGTHAVTTLLVPLLLVAVAVVAVLGLRATARHGAKSLPAVMLGMVLALVLFDKVLSPQYITWLVAPVVYGLILQPRRFRVPALLVLGAALLTQADYPWGYELVKQADPGILLVLGARNLVLLVLFGWTIVRLWRAGTVSSVGVGRAQPITATSDVVP